MQHWEYYAWFLDTSGGAQSILTDLNREGLEGWELVAVTPHESEQSGPVLVATFKRPIAPTSTVPLVA
jgi:hypothetical protein